MRLFKQCCHSLFQELIEPFFKKPEPNPKRRSRQGIQGGNSRGADCATVAKIVNLEKVAEKEKLESVKNESVLTVCTAFLVLGCFLKKANFASD